MDRKFVSGIFRDRDAHDAEVVYLMPHRQRALRVLIGKRGYVLIFRNKGDGLVGVFRAQPRGQTRQRQQHGEQQSGVKQSAFVYFIHPYTSIAPKALFPYPQTFG